MIVKNDKIKFWRILKPKKSVFWFLFRFKQKKNHVSQFLFRFRFKTETETENRVFIWETENWVYLDCKWEILKNNGLSHLDSSELVLEFRLTLIGMGIDLQQKSGRFFRLRFTKFKLNWKPFLPLEYWNFKVCFL